MGLFSSWVSAPAVETAPGILIPPMSQPTRQIAYKYKCAAPAPPSNLASDLKPAGDGSAKVKVNTTGLHRLLGR
jgi:hypothetical protein